MIGESGYSPADFMINLEYYFMPRRKNGRTNPRTPKGQRRNPRANHGQRTNPRSETGQRQNPRRVLPFKLTRRKKEPAYYGDTVTVSDSDKVLVRWKISKSRYRVIYGSLKAETVTKEKLDELER